MTNIHFFQWLRGLLRFGNTSAVIGSLKRRVFRLNFLEMRVCLKDQGSIPGPEISRSFQNFPIALDIRGYNDEVRNECISLLNSVGNLGFWDEKRFQCDILSTVDDPAKDIFLVLEGSVIAGMSVLHKPLSNRLHEIGHVAVRPEHRGRRIGSRLLLYILREAGDRHIDEVFLKTDTFRRAAIKTYFDVGFVPYVKNTNERKRWYRVINKLAIPSERMEADHAH